MNLNEKCNYLRNILLGTFLFSNLTHASTLKEFFLKETEKKGINPTMAYCLMLKESGILMGGKYRPWPFTIRSKDGSRYFGCKEEAIVELKKLQEKGLTNIDLGMSQINLFYQKRRVEEKFGKKIEDLFDPFFNIEIMVDILSENYRQKKNWFDALVFYNAGGNKQKGVPYARRIMNCYKEKLQKGLSYNEF